MGISVEKVDHHLKQAELPNYLHNQILLLINRHLITSVITEVYLFMANQRCVNPSEETLLVDCLGISNGIICHVE